MAYQSLYRRYRPQKFSEIKGQDHVVRALQTAVREDKVGHAYMLHGPRGSGKTSTARVLAKALNCTDLGDDGEPCVVCESCMSIQEGRSFDLQELDAASNNKVDDMRGLLERVNLTSPGRSKVYLLDEVHMLTAGAENALLKTLEEPPAHVTWVLATTEPHKVVQTIRSRCQVFELGLIGAEIMSEHIRYVAADAQLELDAEAIDNAVAAGGGSVRDTLTALERIVTGGGTAEVDPSTDAILAALADHDRAAALSAVGDAVGRGRDPRTIGEMALAGLRDAFLTAMGDPPARMSEHEQARAADLAGRMAPAAITRALETLGRAMIDMRQAPDPRVDMEVALMRLCHPDEDRSLEALAQRVRQLEARLDSPPAGSVLPSPAHSPSTSQPAPAEPAPASGETAEAAVASGAVSPASAETAEAAVASGAVSPASAETGCGRVRGDIPPTPVVAPRRHRRLLAVVPPRRHRRLLPVVPPRRPDGPCWRVEQRSRREGAQPPQPGRRRRLLAQQPLLLLCPCPTWPRCVPGPPPRWWTGPAGTWVWTRTSSCRGQRSFSPIKSGGASPPSSKPSGATSWPMRPRRRRRRVRLRLSLRRLRRRRVRLRLSLRRLRRRRVRLRLSLRRLRRTAQAGPAASESSASTAAARPAASESSASTAQAGPAAPVGATSTAEANPSGPEATAAEPDPDPAGSVAVGSDPYEGPSPADEFYEPPDEDQSVDDFDLADLLDMADAPSHAHDIEQKIKATFPGAELTLLPDPESDQDGDGA